MTDVLPYANLHTIHFSWTGPSVGWWLLAHGPVIFLMSWYILSTPWDYHFLDPNKPIIFLLWTSWGLLSLLRRYLDLWDRILISTTFLLLIPFSVTLAPYTLILVTVIQISSAEGQKKSSSFCSCHPTVVTLYYVAIIFMYM